MARTMNAASQNTGRLYHGFFPKFFVPVPARASSEAVVSFVAGTVVSAVDAPAAAPTPAAGSSGAELLRISEEAPKGPAASVCTPGVGAYEDSLGVDGSEGSMATPGGGKPTCESLNCESERPKETGRDAPSWIGCGGSNPSFSCSELEDMARASCASRTSGEWVLFTLSGPMRSSRRAGRWWKQYKAARNTASLFQTGRVHMNPHVI